MDALQTIVTAMSMVLKLYIHAHAVILLALNISYISTFFLLVSAYKMKYKIFKFELYSLYLLTVKCITHQSKKRVKKTDTMTVKNYASFIN